MVYSHVILFIRLSGGWVLPESPFRMRMQEAVYIAYSLLGMMEADMFKGLCKSNVPSYDKDVLLIAVVPFEVIPAWKRRI